MDDFDEQELYSKINFAAYPPCIIAWGIMLVDNICSRLLGCPNWRHFLLPEKYTSPGSWFSEEHRMNKLPHEFLLEYMPKLMTYQEYLLLESNNIGNGNAQCLRPGLIFLCGADPCKALYPRSQRGAITAPRASPLR